MADKAKHLDFYSKEFADTLTAERKVEVNEVQRRELIINYAVEYGIDFQNRVVTLSEDIEFPMFDFLDAALNLMESESRKTITIKIKSFGGYIHDALAMVGRIEESPCKIVTKGYGAIMSAATILLACGDERHISKRASFMWHEIRTSVDDKASVIYDEAEQLKKDGEMLCKIMGEYTKKPASYWSSIWKRKDVYFTAEEIFDLGVVDRIF